MDESSVDPVLVSGVDDAVEVAAGGTLSCALTSTETLCWGLFSAEGDGCHSTVHDSATPLGIGPATLLSVGGAHACAAAGSDLYCWGAGGSGQLGVPLASCDIVLNPFSDGPVKNSIHSPIALASGGAFTCAVLRSGEVRCWGDNEYGQLGHPGAGGPEPSEPALP
jgi:hypothetical protein